MGKKVAQHPVMSQHKRRTRLTSANSLFPIWGQRNCWAKKLEQARVHFRTWVQWFFSQCEAFETGTSQQHSTWLKNCFATKTAEKDFRLFWRISMDSLLFGRHSEKYPRSEHTFTRTWAVFVFTDPPAPALHPTNPFVSNSTLAPCNHLYTCRLSSKLPKNVKSWIDGMSSGEDPGKIPFVVYAASRRREWVWGKDIWNFAKSLACQHRSATKAATHSQRLERPNHEAGEVPSFGTFIPKPFRTRIYNAEDCKILWVNDYSGSQKRNTSVCSSVSDLGHATRKDLYSTSESNEIPNFIFAKLKRGWLFQERCSNSRLIWFTQKRPRVALKWSSNVLPLCNHFIQPISLISARIPSTEKIHTSLNEHFSSWRGWQLVSEPVCRVAWHGSSLCKQISVRDPASPVIPRTVNDEKPPQIEGYNLHRDFPVRLPHAFCIHDLNLCHWGKYKREVRKSLRSAKSGIKRSSYFNEVNNHEGQNHLMIPAWHWSGILYVLSMHLHFHASTQGTEGWTTVTWMKLRDKRSWNLSSVLSPETPPLQISHPERK